MNATKAASSIALALLVAAGSGAAPAATGDPLPDVDVSIGKKPGGEIVQQVKTDAQGNFSSGVLPKGTYVVTFRPRPAPISSPAMRTVGPGQSAPAVGTAPSARTSVASGTAQGGDGNKSFFESRSNMRVTVAGGGAGPETRSMPMASPQAVVVEAPGGQPIKGKIVE